tara:strand:+ start:981 stop:1526 length:546 start_codon:yes stop_codon:yes gene_type:complete
VNPDQYLQPVKKWLETIVVGLNLCPFAKRELVKNRVRFQLSEATTTAALLTELKDEIIQLDENDSIETTLLIHPWVLDDFFDYNQFLDSADRLLVELDRDGIYQIASFHPDYQFGGTEPEDVENYSNRAPYPILHLLREDSLEVAITNYKDSDLIPANNIALLESMGVKRVQALLKNCSRS